MKFHVKLREGGMQQVLLVEDSPVCRLVVENALADQDIILTKACSLFEAKEIIKEKTVSFFDLILLDLMLPDGYGLSLFDGMDPLEFSEETPIFLLTSKSDLESKINAFSVGIDDYLVKPVNPLELKARIACRLKRVNFRKQKWSIIKKAELFLNVPLLKAVVIRSGKELELDLTGKEFKLLCFLMRHEGRAFSRNDLVKEIWGDGVHVLERTVDSHISGLRRKLGETGKYLESIPGVGYRFSSLPTSKISHVMRAAVREL